MSKREDEDASKRRGAGTNRSAGRSLRSSLLLRQRERLRTCKGQLGERKRRGRVSAGSEEIGAAKRTKRRTTVRVNPVDRRSDLAVGSSLGERGKRKRRR